MNKKKFLTQEEVNNLSIGTKVRIIWSGGNGPHDYVIRTKAGNLSCVDRLNPNAGWYYGQIDFVGKESFHTQVWRR